MTSFRVPSRAPTRHYTEAASAPAGGDIAPPGLREEGTIAPAGLSFSRSDLLLVMPVCGRSDGARLDPEAHRSCLRPCSRRNPDVDAPRSAEVCRFAGTTDYGGHVAVTTDVAAVSGVTRVDVAVTFEATTMFWRHIHYLVEEVSTWRALSR